MKKQTKKGFFERIWDNLIVNEYSYNINCNSQKKDVKFSTNSNNPYEYCGTDDINEIPEHLREECKKNE